jgi:dTDP-4-dehydrorhamnose reductase
MRIFLTGADGQLGMELQRVLSRHQLTLGIWPEFDILKPEAEDRIAAVKPEVVIHAAAYTDVDGAERDPEAAWGVNAEGTERVARAAAGSDARLIYLSTDYVFDGMSTTPYEETDVPNPLNAYGRSKLEGERRALRECPGAVVARTSWLYGHHREKNFVKSIMQQAAADRRLRVVNDQKGNPTLASDLARALAHLVERTQISGIIHAAGSGECTWYEFAVAVIQYMGRTSQVEPIASDELDPRDRPAKRRPYGVLSSAKLAATGFTMPHWRDSLKQFIAEQGVVHVGH